MATTIMKTHKNIKTTSRANTQKNEEKLLKCYHYRIPHYNDERKKRTKNIQNNHKSINKMKGISPHVSVIMFNVN